MKNLLSSWLVATLVFVLSILILSSLVSGPRECRDGWISPSIGKQGACSSHGGVAPEKDAWVFLLSVLLGGAAGWLVPRAGEIRLDFGVRRQERVGIRTDAEKMLPKEFEVIDGRKRLLAPGNILPCPLHGRRFRTSRRGSWVCKGGAGCPYTIVYRPDEPGKDKAGAGVSDCQGQSGVNSR